MTANGRIQASYSAATVVGPLLAGLLVAFVSLPVLLVIDAFSFILSAGSLVLIRQSFNAAGPPRAETQHLAGCDRGAALCAGPPGAAKYLADDGAGQLRRQHGLCAAGAVRQGAAAGERYAGRLAVLGRQPGRGAAVAGGRAAAQTLVVQHGRAGRAGARGRC